MKELMELMAKKKGEKMTPEKMATHMKVLRELRGVANDAIGSEIPSLKKVTVASPTEEGLKEGLGKAEDVISSMDEMKPEDEDEEAGPLAMASDEMPGEESETVKSIMEQVASLSEEEKAALRKALY